jgi:hypothetical protein
MVERVDERLRRREPMERGTEVRFNGGPYGLVSHFDKTRFEEEAVRDGDTGTYLMVHPNPNLPDWHMIEVHVDRDGETVTLFAPLHESQFEAVA